MAYHCGKYFGISFKHRRNKKLAKLNNGAETVVWPLILTGY
jgi:hypothetical protein